MNPQEKNLYDIGWYLKKKRYEFVTPTPESHKLFLRKIKNKNKVQITLRDIFGWSRSFYKDQIPPPLLKLLSDSGAVSEKKGCFKSKIRFSNLGDDLFVHSSFPTVDSDSVFFGPDTYRFASLIRNELKTQSPFSVRRLIDVGCGSGAGAVAALHCLSHQNPEVVYTDINQQALSYAKINAALAGIKNTKFFLSDVFHNVPGSADLILANPPYLNDPKKRLYRHGGGNFGEELSVRIFLESLRRLDPGGRLILYTGTPVINGMPVLLQKLRNLPELVDVPFGFEEIDPDVFGEELEKPNYKQVERITAVSVTIVLPLERRRK